MGSAARKTVYTSLRQFRVPRMEVLYLVIFDRRGGEVELTEAAADVDLYLEVVEGYDVLWGLHYLRVGTLAGGLMFGHALALPPLSG